MTYFGLQARQARVVAAIGSCVFGFISFVALAYKTLVFSAAATSLLLVAGLLVGTTIGWVIEYVAHRPLSRRVFLPWGTIAASAFVAIAVLQTTPLSTQVGFVGFTVLRALLAALALRLLTDAIFGPLDEIPHWAVAAEDMPRWEDAQKWTPARPQAAFQDDDLEPQHRNKAQVAPHDLRLLGEDKPKEDPDSRSKKRRSLP